MRFPDVIGRKRLAGTVLIILSAAVCVRLGIWQLDRLEQRRGFNRQVAYMRSMSTLDLNVQPTADLVGMEWRSARALGRYDAEHQIALRNQYYGGEYGYHLFTPLVFGDGRAILVDRGWIPAEGNSTRADWRKYDQPEVARESGQIRLAPSGPTIGGPSEPTLPPEEGVRDMWNNLDVGRIAAQIPYPILTVYLQLQPEPNDIEPPIPFQPELELTEGPHLGYALQWFAFAAIQLVGYPLYLMGTRT